MKTLITVLLISVTSTPAFAFGIDVGSITPSITYPEPTPAPVTRDATGVEK